MTFNQFEAILKEKRTDITAFKHGTFSGTTQNSVAIIYNAGTPKESKVYIYTGSYIQILNRLGIPTATKQDVIDAKCILNRYKEQHGTEGLFGNILDFSKDISHLEKLIENYKNYVII